MTDARGQSECCLDSKAHTLHEKTYIGAAQSVHLPLQYGQGVKRAQLLEDRCLTMLIADVNSISSKEYSSAHIIILGIVLISYPSACLTP